MCTLAHAQVACEGNMATNGYCRRSARFEVVDPPASVDAYGQSGRGRSRLGRYRPSLGRLVWALANAETAPPLEFYPSRHHRRRSNTPSSRLPVFALWITNWFMPNDSSTEGQIAMVLLFISAATLLEVCYIRCQIIVRLCFDKMIATKGEMLI